MKRTGIAGACVWLGLLVYTLLGFGTLTEIELLFLLAPLVIVPLGLELTWKMERGRSIPFFERFSRTLQFPAALLAVFAFFLPPGVLAATLASTWLLFCGFLGAGGVLRLTRIRRPWLDGVCVILSFLYLPVGGAWLVASRAGLTPMNFQEPIVLLTAVHFHYAGFAAPILARAANRALVNFEATARKCFIPVALGILAGPGLLAVGFVTGPILKLAAAFIIAASEVGLGVYFLLLAFCAGSKARKSLLGISATSVFFAMALVIAWAVGEYARRPILDLFHMESMHGTANALGFVLCGLLGWSMGGVERE